MQTVFQLHLFNYSFLYIIFIFHNTNNVRCLVVDYTRTMWLQRKKYNTEFYLSPGRWLWLDKTVMDYTNWEEGEPNDNSYAAIKTADGTWRTGNRWYDRAYICKTAKGETIIFKHTELQ